MSTKHELEEMTKDELVAYADDQDIEVHTSWHKDEIISEILKAEKAQAKQQAKQQKTEPVAAEEPAPAPSGRSEDAQKQFEAEQEAGRAAVKQQEEK